MNVGEQLTIRNFMQLQKSSYAKRYVMATDVTIKIAADILTTNNCEDAHDEPHDDNFNWFFHVDFLNKKPS